MTDWEHFHHVADIGIRGRGESMAEAFAQAATALMAVVSDSTDVRPDFPVRIECEAPDSELLLVDWLNRLIFEMAVRRMLFSAFEVSIVDHHLAATAWGEPLVVSTHHPVVEAKGATYTELKVCREQDGLWLAQCVVDL
jgi:tRNA nucleotidyltransferase (CCA-adding enzyme)